MKEFLNKVLSLALLFASLNGGAQTNVKNVIPLNLGDKMPEIKLTGIRNYPKSTVSFSEFRNKLVIFDFWMGACKGCILGFPKMEKLQQKFKDRVQIIMVNFESQPKIDSTFGKWSRVSSVYRNPTLPSITSDRLLHQLFLFQYYPHEVWIDGNGKVIAFTSLKEVNEANIRAILDGRPLKMDMKMDFLSFNDYKYPLFSQVYPVYPGKLKFYSVIMGFIPGVAGGTYSEIVDSSSHSVRLVRRNMSLLELSADALLKGLNKNPYTSSQFDFGKRVVLEVANTERYVYLPDNGLDKEQWARENCFTYESVMPLEQKNKMYDNMLEELTRTFDISCNMEVRNLKCYALIRTSHIDKIHSKTKVRTLFDRKRDNTKFQIYSGKLSYLVEAVSRANKNTPFLFADNTTYTKPVDLELSKADLSDITSLNKALATYDLKFVEKILPLEVFVFKEKRSVRPIENK
jgi:thiol-disulfide isomerase/thioredoxin